MPDERWRALAASQAGLLHRAQLRPFGFNSDMVRHRIRTERWVAHTPTVVGTTTGPLTRDQLMWLGVLHAGGDAIVGDLTAAEIAGLRNWHRDDVTILVPRSADLGQPIDGIRFVETRRPLRSFRRDDLGLPVCRLEPAILHFGAYQHSPRTAEGVVAAAVQQQLTTPAALLAWVDRMRPLRRARLFRRTLGEVAGGAQSVAEIDVRRMCRRFRLELPRRQTKRRDANGRLRFTDCEWTLADGRTVVLEVDGSFHMQAEHWEDDVARQRGLTAPDRLVVRCTARELRDRPESVARDLLNLGVPLAA
jgi:hypothetical protein